MYEDFTAVKQAVTIEQVASDLLRKSRGNMFYYPEERTASIKVYPATQSFYDFGRGASGDCIALYAYVNNVSMADAVKSLQAIYGISSLNKVDRSQLAREIAEQKRKRQAEAIRKEQNRRTCLNMVNALKRREQLYRNGIESGIFPPLSEEQAILIAGWQQAAYELDEAIAKLSKYIDNKKEGETFDRKRGKTKHGKDERG